MEDPIEQIEAHRRRVDRLNGIVEGEQVDEGLTAHGYLRKVYQNPLEPTHVRMRAASLAIEYEMPKLRAAAILYSGDFSSMLERAIERTEPALLEAQAIEADPDE
jgi:hypothetical protein